MNEHSELELAWFNHTAEKHGYSGTASCEECDVLWQRIVDHWHKPKPAEPPPTQPKPIPHGTTGGYTNHKCRCPECTAAATKHHREYMWRTGKHTPQHIKTEQAKANRKHGTLMKYRDGCRCDECRAKANETKRNQHARNIEHYRQLWRDAHKRRKARAMSSDTTD